MSQPEMISIGELLIDLISTEYAADFRSADQYQRIAGGSPANLAMNMARLGRKVALVATVGKDDAGALLIDAVQETGVDTSQISRHEAPTTLILVTKSRAVSNFEPYRLADRYIMANQLSDTFLSGAKIVHTTAFALSQDPARTNILDAMARAAKKGARPSVDFNYADKIWGDDRAKGLDTLKYIAAMGALIKVSEVDYARLFGEEVADYHTAARRLKDLGAYLVCLTLGEEGCYVLSDVGGFHLPARPVEVKDTTGAGDAFWSGFLSAFLAGYNWQECALAGRGMAELKLSRVGAVQETVTLAGLIAG